MSDMLQSIQFKVEELYITLNDGKKYDISAIFREVNIFENIFVPTISGNLLIEDSIGLADKFSFDGSETIKINIDKGEGSNEKIFKFNREFRIYKISERKNISQTVQSYIIHFVTEDFIYSQQLKLKRNFTGSYSEAVKTILTDILNVPDKIVSSDGKSGINLIKESDGTQQFNIPNLTPFESIDWITKRAISKTYNLPDFVFYENKFGYNLVPLSFLLTNKSVFELYFNPKNFSNSSSDELFSARQMKVISEYDLPRSIKDGVYGGKFVGFDTLTKTFVVREITNAFRLTDFHANKKDNLTDGKSKGGKQFDREKNSRVVVYPFALPRSNTQYIIENNSELSSFIDDTHDYVFQRKSLISNLMQKRMQLVMAGNFGYFVGANLDLKVPRYSIRENEQLYDESLSGKYIILATRHIIKYDRHETILEIATDSNKK